MHQPLKISFKTACCFIVLMLYPILSGCSTTQPQAQTETSAVPSITVLLLKDHVTCRIPTRWVLTQESKEDGHRQAYFIPFQAATDTNDTANASLVAQSCSTSLTVREYSDSILAQMINPKAGNVIISDQPDGPFWRSVFWRGQGQIPYVIWDRFGVENGVSVHLRVAYPLLKNSSQAQQLLTNEINAVTESLKIQ